MKIKEGGGMENPEKIEIEGLKTIHKLCKFGADHNMEGCTFTEIVERMFSKIEQMKTQVNTLDEMLLNQGEALAQAKTQAVPEWKDYTVESPRIDGPYQIFIMNQQLVAKWESPWGFSSIEDGDALNQELITHWSVLGNDPAIEPREPAND